MRGLSTLLNFANCVLFRSYNTSCGAYFIGNLRISTENRNNCFHQKVLKWPNISFLKMKVLLVQPTDKTSNYSPKRPVLWAAYVSATLKKEGHDVKFFDCRLKEFNDVEFKELLKSYNPDFVCFSIVALTHDCTFRYMKYVRELLDAKIIAGGPEVTTFPEDFLKLKLINFIFIGAADISFPKFLRLNGKNEELQGIGGFGYKENDKIHINKKAEVYNIDDVPFPDWDIFTLSSYKKNVSRIEFPIQSARGCPHNCIFCSVPSIVPSYRMRSAKNVVDELELIHKKYGTKKFQFQDDNFGMSKQRTLEICDEIIKSGLKIKWSVAQGFTAQSGSYEVFKKMKEAGCTTVGIGVESTDPEVLKFVRKPASLQQLKDAFINAKKAGITTKGFFIVGLPGSTYEKEMKNIDFFKEVKIDIPRFGNVMTYPKTELMDWVKKNAKSLIDFDEARNVTSENVASSVDTDMLIKPVFETDDFSSEDRMKAFNKCNEEAEKWALNNLFGKFVGPVAYKFSRVKFIRDIGEKVLDLMGGI